MNIPRPLSRGLVLSLLVAAATTSAVYAQTNTDILGKSCDYVTTIKNWIFGVAYVLGAIGLVLVAVSAFLGRFKFSHLIALGGGLFIVATADLLIRFATDGKDSTTCTATGA